MDRLRLEFSADAIAVAEFSTIPTGLTAADAATKGAEINLLFTGSIHPGKFLMALEGGVSETELALKAALESGRQTLIDSVHIPFPHPQIRREQNLQIDAPEPALLILETLTVPSLLRGLDRALKSTDCILRLKHLADHLGGKSIAVLEGELHDIETARLLLQDAISASLLSDLQLIPRAPSHVVTSFLKSLR